MEHISTIIARVMEEAKKKEAAKKIDLKREMEEQNEYDHSRQQRRFPMDSVDGEIL